MAALKTAAAARYLGIGKTKLYGLVRTGEVAYVDQGGTFTFLEADLDEYLNRHRVPSKAEREPAPRYRRDAVIALPDRPGILTGRPLRHPAPAARGGAGR